MKQFIILATAIGLFFSCQRQQAPLPTLSEKVGFARTSTNAEINDFLKTIAETNKHFQYFELGQNTQGQSIGALKIAKGEFGENPDKLRVLIFAQQHGNEPSGMEACLLWIAKLSGRGSQSILKNLDICIIPQLNPFGGDSLRRTNAEGTDLNRDHLLLTAPETIALQKLFHQYLFHVTIDIHEYYPYGRAWREFGAFKNFDVQVGTLTNPNVAPELRNYALEQVFPLLEEQLNQNNFSFFHYIVGPAPNLGPTRHSTADINDGRQSFGILNTLSFIFEGLNGKDSTTHNLEHRARAQLLCLETLIDKLSKDARHIHQMVGHTRDRLIAFPEEKKVSIRIEHHSDGTPLRLPLISASTNRDTLIEIQEYLSKVVSTLDVAKPKAYLIPDSCVSLIDLLKKHHISFQPASVQSANKASAYLIKSLIESVDEELENVLPEIVETEVEFNPEHYIYVPLNQISGNKLVIMLEPQSLFGLINTSSFNHLLKEGGQYPVLRIN